MKWSKNKKKISSLLALGFFVVIGTYNAVVINSESQISTDVKFVKRLDEIYGVTKAGRDIAAVTTWHKLSKDQVVEAKRFMPVVQRNSAPVVVESANKAEEITVAAAVQDDLSLSLVEITNPSKSWQQANSSGSLNTSNGMIESLDVTLPNGEALNISYSKLAGNVFEYDYEGEKYSGMLYQIDQSSYMVTFSNGPLAETRLRFNAAPTPDQQMQTEQYLAENHNVEVGNFGGEQPEVQPEVMAENVQENQTQTQGFNFENQQPI